MYEKLVSAGSETWVGTLTHSPLLGTPSMCCHRSPWPVPLGPVCADNHPDELWGHLAMFLPSRVAVFPDWIHDFPDRSLHKLLHSGKPHPWPASEFLLGRDGGSAGSALIRSWASWTRVGSDTVFSMCFVPFLWTTQRSREVIFS